MAVRELRKGARESLCPFPHFLCLAPRCGPRAHLDHAQKRVARSMVGMGDVKRAIWTARGRAWRAASGGVPRCRCLQQRHLRSHAQLAGLRSKRCSFAPSRTRRPLRAAASLAPRLHADADACQHRVEAVAAHLLLLFPVAKMTEYWVSQARHWCEYCKIYINGSKSSIAFHEQGRKQ